MAAEADLLSRQTAGQGVTAASKKFSHGLKKDGPVMACPFFYLLPVFFDKAEQGAQLSIQFFRFFRGDQEPRYPFSTK